MVGMRVVEEIRSRGSYEKIVRTINSSTCLNHIEGCIKMVYNYHGLYGNTIKTDVIADRANTLLCLIKLRREVLEDLGDTSI